MSSSISPVARVPALLTAIHGVGTAAAAALHLPGVGVGADGGTALVCRPSSSSEVTGAVRRPLFAPQHDARAAR